MAIDLAQQPYNGGATGWSSWTKIVFRIFFIYFLIQVVPLDPRFYRELFSIDNTAPAFTRIFAIAHYSPGFSTGVQSYADWAIILLVAVLGAGVWTYIARNKTASYNQLYYWLRVLVRYRLAIGVIAYGFIKLFPIQAPFPSISNLNTNYGDFTRWKLFSLSLGIVPGYESFLGAVEIITGLLLLYRKTASIGAFIVIIFTGNVFMSNLAYDGGEQVYSLYLISLALFVLAFDLKRLTDLLIFQRPAAPVSFIPHYTTKARFYTRIALKTAFILFFVGLYGWQTGSAFYQGAGRFPQEQGLANAAGLYNVSSFRINADSLGYAPNDARRWQDVVFEKWNTISIRYNRSVVLDSNNTDRIVAGNQATNYELEGSASRHYFSYTVDTLQRTLLLKNKNKHFADESLLLHYRRSANDAFVLYGTNENKDSVYAVLNKINKRYLLEEVAKTGRQRSIKL